MEYLSESEAFVSLLFYRPKCYFLYSAMLRFSGCTVLSCDCLKRFCESGGDIGRFYICYLLTLGSLSFGSLIFGSLSFGPPKQPVFLLSPDVSLSSFCSMISSLKSYKSVTFLTSEVFGLSSFDFDFMSLSFSANDSSTIPFSSRPLVGY